MTVTVGGFEFDIEGMNEKLKREGIGKILLQVPDGLRRKIGVFQDAIEAEVTVWGGTCYGACDLPLDIGESEALVHVGHTEIPGLKVDYPVFYVEGRNTVSRPHPQDLSEMMVGEVALYSTVQYLEQMDSVARYLEDRGCTVAIGKGDDRIKYPGQLLGCNFSARVDGALTHLYVGTGRFHPLGLSLSLKKEVLIFDPVTGEMGSTYPDADRMIRRRFATIQRIRESTRTGIIVSQKQGQRRFDTARDMCRLCEVHCTVVEFDEIEPHLVDSFDWDGLVNTACPRLALDDSIRFEDPVVTPVEYIIAQGEMDWEDWTMDEIKG